MSENTTPQNVTDLPEDHPTDGSTPVPFYKNPKILKIVGVSTAAAGALAGAYWLGKTSDGYELSDEDVLEVTVDVTEDPSEDDE